MAVSNPAYDNIQNPLDYIDKVGDWIAKSGMCTVTNANQGRMIAMVCLSERKHPLEVKRTYHFFQNGEISMRADYMLGAFHAAGGESEPIQRDANGASIKLTWKGKSSVFSLSWAEAQEERFPWCDAKKKDKLKDNWSTPRGRMQMMWARVVSDGIRTIKPEIVAGVYTPEEVQDFDDTPAARKATAKKAADDVVDAEFEKSPVPADEGLTPARVQEANEVAAVVEATASSAEQAPFETDSKPVEAVVVEEKANPSHRQAMELELAANLVVLQMTDADCLTQLQKKVPSLKSLDELTDEQFGKVNDRFRALAQQKN